MATAAEQETVVPADVEKDGHTQDSSSMKGKVSEKLLKHSHDADAAMKAFEGIEGQAIELTEETNKRLLRKIDLHLMPVSRLFSVQKSWYLVRNTPCLDYLQSTGFAGLRYRLWYHLYGV
jgi:hypothetical protein